MFKAAQFEVVQQVEYLPPNYPALLQQIVEEKPKFGLQWVLHDKDVLEDGTPKEPHYHVYVRTSCSYDSTTIANIFKVQDNNVQKVKSTKGARFYQMHLRADNTPIEGKYQYPESEIHLLGDIRPLADCDGHKKKETDRDEDFEKYVSLFNEGKTLYEVRLNADPVVWAKYEKLLVKTYDTLQWQKKERGELSMGKNVFYIYGEAGSGKSELAKYLGKTYFGSYSITATGMNPFDGYNGEGCLIWDDWRPEPGRFADFLGILDPYTVRDLKARYANKPMYDCRGVIITNTLPLTEAYSHLLEVNDGAFEQAMRRIQAYFKCLSCDYPWDGTEGCLRFVQVDRKGETIGEEKTLTLPRSCFSESDRIKRQMEKDLGLSF